MVCLKLPGIVLIAALLSQTLAHPGEDRAREIAKRAEFLQYSKRGSNCDGALRKRGIDYKQHKRRLRALEEARAARGLPQSEFFEFTECGTITNMVFCRNASVET